MKPLMPQHELSSINSRRRRGHRFVVEALEGRTLLSATPTTLSLSASQPALYFSQSETITATIGVPVGSTAPSEGMVTFSDGPTTLGTAPVSDGMATYTTTALALGSHLITASYSGTANDAASSFMASPSIVPASGLADAGGVAVDSSRDVFIADTLDNRVIEVRPNGSQSTIAAGLGEPLGIAVDGSGNVFIADSDNNRVIKVTPDGSQTTIASGLNSPEGVAVDGSGDIFIADTSNNRVIEVTPNGSTKPVGTGLSHPEGVAVDTAGDLFIADFSNSRLVEVTPKGVQTTVLFGISSPSGVAVDAAGDLFIANGQTLKVTPSGKQTILSPPLDIATAVAADAAGDAFFADSSTNQVLEIANALYVTVSPVPSSVRVVAGSPSTFFGQNENFTATVSVPKGATTPSAGTVTFFDGATALQTSAISGGVANFTTPALTLGTHTITAAYGGAAGYLASTPGIEPTSSQVVVTTTGLVAPVGVAVDSVGNEFILDRNTGNVIKITPKGTQSTIASGLALSNGLAVDTEGDVFIADTGNDQVLKVTPSGSQSTVASGLGVPVGVAVDAAGDIFITTTANDDVHNDDVLELTPAGLHPIASGLTDPTGVAVDAVGNVFIADEGNNRVLEVSPSGTVTPIATGLEEPTSVAVDAAGDVFIADSGASQVLELTPMGSLTPVASGLRFPEGMAVNGQGDLFIADNDHARIVEVMPGLPVSVIQSPTSTSVAVSLTSALFGQTETLTATISVPGGAMAPSVGTVTFFDNNIPLGTAPVSMGAATFTTSALALGSHTITASFGGTATYAASSSGVETASSQSVVPGPGNFAPLFLAVDAAGDLFMSDGNDGRVLKVTPSGTKTVVVPGLGIADGLAVDALGDLFIVDNQNGNVLELTASGPKIIASGLSDPTAVAVDAAGNVFIADPDNNQVLKVTPTGARSTVGSGLVTPVELAVDGAGDVFIADYGDNRVVKVTPGGVQTTFESSPDKPNYLAADSAGDVFINLFIGGEVFEVTTAGVTATVGGDIFDPAGLAVDNSGAVFLADPFNEDVLKLTPGVPVTVSQAAPVLAWTKPADITTGTPLGTAQLDAIANVPGTFTYTPATGTVLPLGTGQVLSVTFTPTDTKDYTSVTASTVINVVIPPPVIIGETALFKRKIKHRKPVGKPTLVGYMIDWSGKLNPSSANLAANYQVDMLGTKIVKKKKVLVVQPLNAFTVSYNDVSTSVDLLFTSPQTFNKGGRITVDGGPLDGVSSPSGAFVTGNRVLAISPGGKSIKLV
jgi:sugar lactone lactonase YvrE